jgi:predicted dienelactone hydrolase
MPRRLTKSCTILGLLVAWLLTSSFAAAQAEALSGAAPPAELALAAPAGKDNLAVVPPIGPGPYQVACSDVAQDFSRLQPGDTPDMYWEGEPNAGQPRYVTALLSEPASSVLVNVTVPRDRELFDDYAGQTIPYAVLVCYPTTPDNPRPGYLLPNGALVPHMQRAGDLPLFAADRARYPVLLFSHGLSGSPLSGDYLAAVDLLASYGYVVIAPFHGDARIADIHLEDFADLGYAILHFGEYTAMQALRPLSLEAALNVVLADPRYAERVDANAIGGFGGSLGGESLLLMAGARLTVSIGQSSKAVMNDPRLKAAVGYVPYFGQPVLPAFGRDQNGLAGVTLPYLAISGTSDVTAPLTSAAQGVAQLASARQLVALEGVSHGFDPAAASDIFTWSLTFLGAYVGDDPLLRARSARMTEVSGGVRDDLLLDGAVPLPPDATQRLAIEFYNPSLDHYFITAEPAEAAMLDAGVVVPGWYRTGDNFKVWGRDAPFGVPACRFFGTPGLGPNSHFFTIDPDECAKVMADPAWTYEGLAFRTDPPMQNDCPADRVPVVRLYNDGKGGEANHRYLTSHSAIYRMLLQGWIREGVVFCGLP